MNTCFGSWTTRDFGKAVYFIQAVASAFARFPIDKTLELRDSNLVGCIRFRKFVERANDNDILRHSLLHPIAREEPRNHQLGQPPAEILVKLPSAIRKTGGLINTLETDMSAVYSLLSSVING
jgi:hypothetical protein